MKLEISPETFEEFKQLVTSTIFEALKYSSSTKNLGRSSFYDELYKIPIRLDIIANGYDLQEGSRYGEIEN